MNVDIRSLHSAVGDRQHKLARLAKVLVYAMEDCWRGDAVIARDAVAVPIRFRTLLLMKFNARSGF